MTPLTPETLAELERLEAKATKGPWYFEQANGDVFGIEHLGLPPSVYTKYLIHHRGGNVDGVEVHGVILASLPTHAEFNQKSEADVTLSVALRNAAPALIAAARRERALREAAASVVADYDRAKSYKYDEIKWAEFKGVDPLLAALSPNPAPAERE